MEKVGLVLGGGGAKGAHSAGAVQEAVTHFPPYTRGFDNIYGTSAGAITGVGLSMFPKAEIRAGADWAVDQWLGTTEEDIYKVRQPLGIPALWAESVAKTAALECYLRERINPERLEESGVRFTACAVDLVTGAPVYYEGAKPDGDVTPRGPVDPIGGVMSSGAYPCWMPPRAHGAYWVTDGGVGLATAAAISLAIEDGCERILVCLTDHPRHFKYKQRKELKTTIQIGLRVLDLLGGGISHADVKVAKTYNLAIEGWSRAVEFAERLRSLGVDVGPFDVPEKVANKRTVKIDVVAARGLGGALEFDLDTAREYVELGRRDARDALEAAR